MKQYLISIGSIAFLSLFCFYIGTLSYPIVALLLLLLVSILAMLLDFLPVLLAAFLSALVLNFLFMPPIFTLHIQNGQDILLFLMYFVVAMVSAVLTAQIRKAEQKVRAEQDKEKALQLYNTLFNSLSHELKTPLATIIGIVDTLKENETFLPQLLPEIEIATWRLNRQVENLLNISRLESGTLSLKRDWCDMNELVFSVIQKLQEIDKNRLIQFQNDEKLPFFQIDRGLIEQVIYNLLLNALQHTAPDVSISIEVKNEKEGLKIEISDNGKGFPEEEINSVFEKFYRLPQSKAGGTGLGLSIVKGFIMAHEGTILLQNKENGGAIFSIQIPAPTSFISHLKND